MAKLIALSDTTKQMTVKWGSKTGLAHKAK
jgi:hypothetical protein